MSTYNESKFHMWRACIGVVWVDGDLDANEENWVLEKIKNLNFTDEQREILKQDLKGSIDFPKIVSKITDKKDRAFLVHEIRVIGHLDDDYSSHEQELLNSWREFVLKGVDLVELEKIIAEDEKASYHEDEVYKVHNKHSRFERIYRAAQKIMNPGDYKFPK